MDQPGSVGMASGGVSAVERGAVRGWARGDGLAPAIVELWIDGRLVADAIAAGAGDSFAIELVSADRPDGVRTGFVRVRNGDRLENGTVTLDPGLFVAPPPAREVWPALPWRLAAGLEGYIDRFGPGRVHGWAQATAARSAKPELAWVENGEAVGAVRADIWRKDLEETRQGDGRWGIDAEVPRAFRDGRWHRISVQDQNGADALGHPVLVRVPPGDAEPAVAPSRPDDLRARRLRPAREDVPAGILFSLVVVFHNMRREAARTLRSLARDYQRGIGALGYEVICIDNGSAERLDPDFVASFGPEFRLITPEPAHPSPVAAINAAAAGARGRYLAIMIDGAHVLSPGVLREAWDAVTEAPEAIVAVRQWFVGGDQRWLAAAGHRREDEDLLFDRIGWPDDGYRLFEIGTPIWESPNCWIDGMIESNCLFLSRDLWDRLGGMDARFDEPGAGYANLDLFYRAAMASPEPIVGLLGEASFHQFHQGTTTNVPVATKEARVRAYELRYAALRGKPFAGFEPVDIRVRGQMQTLRAFYSRQRPASPARIGVTERLRPGSLPHHFDVHAQEYLQSAYVECGLHEAATWLGQPLGVAPADALQIQALLVRLRPERIVMTNAAAGLLCFVEQVRRLADLAATRVIAAGSGLEAVPGEIVRIAGPAAEAAGAVRRAIGSAESVFVIFAPDPADWLPIGVLREYAEMVTLRSYLVFLGTALGQPWIGYSRRWYMKAIRLLVEGAPFAIDRTCQDQLITTSPMGYLQRIEPPPRL